MSVKVALVTGGVAGIGEAIALGLADDGYKVVVCDINQERGQAVEERNPGKLVFRECNVADEESVQALVRGVVEEFGRIDVLVNNAGIIRRRHSEEISVADWDIVFTVNVRGASLLCKYVAEVMKQQGTGRIVNISSVAAMLGTSPPAPGYGPSKLPWTV